LSSVWHRSLVWLASALVAAVALLVPRAALAAGPSCDARAASIAPDVVAMCVALTRRAIFHALHGRSPLIFPVRPLTRIWNSLS